MRTHTGRVQSQTGDNNLAGQFIDNRDLEEMENKLNVRLDGTDKGGKSQENANSRVSFADLRKQKHSDQFHTSGININYMENEKADVPKKSAYSPTNRRSSGSTDQQSNKTTWGAQPPVVNNQNLAQQADGSSSPGDLNSKF